MIIIPRYYYMGTAEDTMRDPMTLRLKRSMQEAYRDSSLDWGIKTPVLLMYGHNLELLAAKDIAQELLNWEQWHGRELNRIHKEYPENDPYNDGTLKIARQLAWEQLKENIKLRLEGLAFKILEEQSKCATS